jgi:hypothetical protein
MDDSNPQLSVWRPTVYDSLGIEILYPKAGFLSLGCQNCVQSESGLVVRTNGTLLDNWSARDAYPWWSVGTLPAWNNVTTGTTLPSGATLAAGKTSGIATLKTTATNRWNNKVITSQSVVEVNDAKWTSIVAAVL